MCVGVAVAQAPAVISQRDLRRIRQEDGLGGFDAPP